MLRPSSRLGAVLHVSANELRSALRDRQTALYTFVLPICMYPIVFWIAVQGFLVVQGVREHTDVRVVVVDARAGSDDGLSAALARPGEGVAGAGLDPVHVTAGAELQPELPDVLEPDALRPLLSARGGARARFNGVLHVPALDGEPARLYYDSSDARGELARERVGARVEAHVRAAREAAVRAAGLDLAVLEPLAVRSDNIAPAQDSGAFMLSLILPLMLITMAVMGAFFPAVDMTAGEKERRTAETTLLLPISRAATLEGKVLATALLAVTATALNILAIGLSAQHLLSIIARSGSVRIDLPVKALVFVAPFAALFAFFTAALLVSVAGLARSFKEGQALLGPVQMIFILPAMIGVVPGIDLNVGWALVPVVNVVLTFKALLVDRSLPLPYALTAVSCVVYALVAMRFAVRVLSREAVALSGETLPLHRLFALVRTSGSVR